VTSFLERIFTSKDVVPGKEVPFGGLDDYILYLNPCISEKPPFWGLILTLQPKNRFNMGMLQYKLPLIVIVAPKSCIANRQFGVKKLLRVVLGDPLCSGHVILRMRSDFWPEAPK